LALLIVAPLVKKDIEEPLFYHAGKCRRGGTLFFLDTEERCLRTPLLECFWLTGYRAEAGAV